MAFVAHERVVARHGAIIVEPQDFAAQAHRILRNRRHPAAGGHVDLAVTPKGDTAVETRVPFVCLGNKKVSDVGERSSLESAPRERRCASAVTHGLGIGEIDEAIVGKLGMEGDIHQPAIAVGSNRWHAGNGVRFKHSIANDAETPGPLGDQHASVGKERDGPWIREPFGHDADPEPCAARQYRTPMVPRPTAAPVRRARVAPERG